MNLRTLLAAGIVMLVGFNIATTAASRAVVVPPPDIDDALASTSGRATMVVAGGCFWGIEEVYQHVRGVTDAVSGYSGGTAKTADYETVSTGTTGHAESVKVTYDPSVVSYGQLLRIFFSVAHDPTQRGGQGPDRGPQYRSVVFYAGERQQQIARAYMEQITGTHVFKNALTTQVVPLQAFYDAEPYHQDYARRNQMEPYIFMNDLPKVEHLKKLFASMYH